MPLLPMLDNYGPSHSSPAESKAVADAGTNIHIDAVAGPPHCMSGLNLLGMLIE